MTELTLTKTRMLEGVWQSVLTGAGEDKPDITVMHEETTVPDFKLVRNDAEDYWLLSVPIPASAIADGVQTLLVMDRGTDEKIGQIVMVADGVVSGDLHAEMELLRAELDMLKRAFRRHCLETT